jgi:hypothetical protein
MFSIRRVLRLSLPGLLAAIVASAAWIATPRHAVGMDPSPFFLNNEAIGTLPGYWVDNPPWWIDLYFGGPGGIVETQAPTTCYVPKPLMKAFVLNASGKGIVLLDHTGVGDEVRMRFFGDVQLRFDLELLAGGTAKIGTTMGSKFAGGEAALIVGNRASNSFALPAAGQWLALPAGKSGPGGYCVHLAALDGSTATIAWVEGPLAVRVIQDMP